MNSPARPPIGSIVWHDLTIPEAEAVRDFYAQVVGWKHSSQSMDDYDDYNMEVGDAPVAGICHARGPNANLPPLWLMYISVRSIEESTKRCVELGGRILDGPRPLGGSPFCVIQDPAGAVVALIEAAK